MNLKLNTLKPAKGSKKNAKRVGRGIGSTLGKTCGRGHKGQKSRSGGSIKIGFEGGQMPLQRRLPKFGFSSRVGRVTDQVRLSTLAKLAEIDIDFSLLKAKGLIRHNIKDVKIFLDKPIEKTINLKGLRVTKGAKASIEKAGGKIE